MRSLRLALIVGLLSLAASSASAAIALVGHITASSVTSSTFTTGTLDTTGATLIVVAVEEFAVSTLSDNMSNGAGTSLTLQTGSNIRLQIHYYTAPTVGAGHTWTATGTGTFTTLAVSAWSGVATSTPFDVENGASVTGTTTIQPGSVTPGTSGSLLLFAIGNNQVIGTDSIDNGFVVLDRTDVVGGQHEAAAHGYLIQSVAAPINPTWTIANNDDILGRIAVFKPSAGGGGGCTQFPSVTLLGVGGCGG